MTPDHLDVVINRIRKLMALTADRGASEAEAELAADFSDTDPASLPARRPRTDGFWQDPGRAALLAELWAEGLSASRIAARVPGSTRSSVLAAARRYRLPPRRDGERTDLNPRGQPHLTYAHIVGRMRGLTREQQRGARSRGATAGQKLEAAANRPPSSWEDRPSANDLAIPAEQRRRLLELGPGDCRWPVGDPGAADFFFCGGRTWREGTSYCARHALVGTRR